MAYHHMQHHKSYQTPPLLLTAGAGAQNIELYFINYTTRRFSPLLRPCRYLSHQKMRLIVPLQGVLQGRGGLLFGSLIPCALYYFLQFYLKRHRSPPPPLPPPSSSSNPPSPSSSSSNIPELTRTASRSNLSSGRVFVSARASLIAKPNDSAYYIGLDRVREDPYHAVDNPDGIIQLGLSENTLTMDLIDEWLSKNFRIDGLDIRGIATYQPSDGLLELKVAMAGFMNQVMGGTVSFNPSQLVITSGATPAIEILCFSLADHGNAFLIPTPYYPGFDRDIKFRTGVELIPVHCHSSDNFALNITALEHAFNQARKRGQKVRGILISNPSNPLGTLLNHETLNNLLDFAREKNIHIISDEIFAGSVYGDEEFVSMAEIIDLEHFDKDRVHIIYGLSKDLCLPGFRVGAIYSFNENVLAASRRLTRFSSVSDPTQRILVHMLSDSTFTQNFLKTNKQRIRAVHKVFVEMLEELGLEFIKSSAGMYCWVNMNRIIEKDEVELWEKMLYTAKINATPGSACHCIEPGWFRCCFTTLNRDDIPVIMDRMRKIVGTRKNQGP